MATETLSRNEIDNACRTLAIRTLGIDLESYERAMGIDLDVYRSTIENANDCTAAIKLLADQSPDGGLVLLLRGIQSNMESVAGDLIDTGRALGIEPETV